MKWLRLLVSVLLLAWLATRFDVRQLARSLAGLRWELWLAAVGLYLVTQVVSGLRWQVLARPLGFRRPLAHYVGFYFIGMFFNLVLPTSVGGDVVRAWYLDGGSGRRLDAFLSVFVDRLSGLLVLLAMGSLAAALSPVALPWWLAWGVWGATAAAALGLAALPVLARHRLLSGRYERLGVQIPKALSLALHPAPFALSLFVQAANVVLVWLVGLALEVPVPAAYYWVLVPAVTLLTLVPISLNGMGVREGGTALLLAPLGVAAGPAVALAFLWFAVFSVASLAGIFPYLFGRFPRYEGACDAEPVGGDPGQGRARQPSAAA